MSKISIQKNQILLNGTSIPLISGEFHYWRVQTHYWEKCLQRVKEMSIDIIASYICWEFHEYAPGKLDFTGETIPGRNLIKFLERCQSMDFKVIIRPGPYIYSEWQHAGVPERVAQYHRLHPNFLKEAENYIAQVVHILKPFFMTNNGPIILLQADNEIDSFSIFHADQLGLYGGDSLFQKFLKEKYRTIENLNRTWRASLNDFSEAMATFKVKVQRPESQIRALDFWRFHYWCAKKIARWAIQKYKAAGVDIPIYLNTVQNCYSQNLREMADEFSFVGIDLYPSNEFQYYENELLTLLRNVSYTSAVADLPYIAECQSGVWHGHHYKTGNLSANHYRMSCLTALIGGIVGWNWYMLVERDNWYNAPINSRGYKRPEFFDPMKKIAEVFKQINPSEFKKVTDTAITEDESHFIAEFMGHKNVVAQAVFQSGIPFKSHDLLKQRSDCKLLLYAGPEWMSRKCQENLYQFVTDGGILVCFNIIPHRDEEFKSYSKLPFEIPDGSTMVKNFDVKLNSKTIRVKDSISLFRDVSAHPIFAHQSEKQGDDIFAEENYLLENLDAGKKFIVGYQKQIGKGKTIFIGCAPTPALVIAIHQMTGIPIYCRANTPNIISALFQKNENHYFLIVVNHANQDRDVRIWLESSLFANTSWTVQNLFTDQHNNYNFGETPSVIVTIPKNDGTILALKKFES